MFKLPINFVLWFFHKKIENRQTTTSGQQSQTYESSFHFATVPQVKILRSFAFIVQNDEHFLFVGQYISPDDPKDSSSDSSDKQNKSESGSNA